MDSKRFKWTQSGYRLKKATAKFRMRAADRWKEHLNETNRRRMESQSVVEEQEIATEK